eukprot:215454-Chlamydomonas_euryale.AAC.2
MECCKRAAQQTSQLPASFLPVLSGGTFRRVIFCSCWCRLKGMGAEGFCCSLPRQQPPISSGRKIVWRSRHTQLD